MVILANSIMTLITKVRERADGDKVQNADGAERRIAIVGLAATIAAVKVAEEIAATTATKARARVNVPKVPAGDNPLQVSKTRTHAAFICRADVTGVTIATGTIQKRANDGEQEPVLSTDTLASISMKNAHRVKSHATQPQVHAVHAAVEAPNLHRDLHVPLASRQGKVHINRLLDPAHRAAHANQVEKRSVNGDQRERTLLTQRRKRRRSAKRLAENANHVRKLMPFLRDKPDHNTGGTLVEP